MKASLKKGLTLVLLVAVVGALVTGCSTFRRQALETQTQLDNVIRRAETAEDAAARNAGRIIELEHRIDALEEALVKLQETDPNN